MDRQITDFGRMVHGFWMVGARGLDAGCITHSGRRARVRARYWAVDVASVPVVAGGGLSLAAGVIAGGDVATDGVIGGVLDAVACAELVEASFAGTGMTTSRDVWSHSAPGTCAQ